MLCKGETGATIDGWSAHRQRQVGDSGPSFEVSPNEHGPFGTLACVILQLSRAGMGAASQKHRSRHNQATHLSQPSYRWELNEIMHSNTAKGKWGRIGRGNILFVLVSNTWHRH